MTLKKTDKLTTENINFKGGVLIIGSLLWQNHLKNENEDNIRKLWRDRNLLMNHRIMVKTPIRYGRLSENDNIYTMVFSNACAKRKKGTGYFIPFKKNPFSNFNDILKEAKEVSIAEGMKGKFVSKEKGTKKVWCVLGILTNPKISEEHEQTLLIQWTNTIDSQGSFDPNDFKQGREKSCLNKSGKLNIDWPVSLDKRNNDILNSYDFIIATGTKPTDYPNIETLKENVIDDKSRYYFIENYNSGITTFQDIEVINKLEDRNANH